MRKLLGLLIILLLIAGILLYTGFFRAEVKGGSLPRVSAEGGSLPSVDVDTKKVVVGTTEKTVEVPVVRTEERSVDVPVVATEDQAKQ